MSKNTEMNNLITVVIWSLVGLLAGILLGRLFGLEEREIIFPAIVGLVLVGIAAYRYTSIPQAGESDEKKAQAPEPKVEPIVAENNIAKTATITKKASRMGEIDGVIISSLNTYPDDRGYFREIFRLVDSPIDEATQVSATMSYPGVIKAFHYHKKQDDLWYCAKGMIQAVMYDLRPNSRTYGTTQVVPMGDLSPRTLFIPRGVVHGYKVLGPEAALVIYATTQVYDPNDELRIPHDDKEIGFDWSITPR